MSRIRLTCPECGAQYEVPVDVIPEGGRDVQCSNCQHTWFQHHPDDASEAEEALSEPPRTEPEAEDVPPPPRAAAEAPSERRARRMDPAVETVLREERDYENRRRAAEADTIESQPDLGLSEPDAEEEARRARSERDRLAQSERETPRRTERPERTPVFAPPEEPDEDEDYAIDDSAPARAPAAAATAAASRRELLPDVETISQSLRDDHKPRAVDQAERQDLGDLPRKRSGFGKGFFLIVVLAAIGVAVYASAPQIAESAPALAEPLSVYVATVDAGRAWLDAQLANLMATLDGMSSEAAGDGS